MTKLLFDTGAGEAVGDALLQRLARADEVAGQDQLDARRLPRAMAPRGVTHDPGVPVDLHEAAFGPNALERVASLVAVDADDGRGVSAPAAGRIMRVLQGHARVPQFGRVIEQRASAHLRGVESVRIVCEADLRHRGDLIRRLRGSDSLRRGQGQHGKCAERCAGTGRTGERTRHYLEPQVLRVPSSSDRYPATLAGCRIRL